MTMPDGAANEGVNSSGQGNDSGGVNPAWNDVLNVVPQDLHSQVTPHLRNWDNNFQRVQSDYAPFREFKDAGISPDQLKMGMGLMQALEQNPRQVYDLLAQQFNFGAEDTGQGNSDESEDDFANLPDAVKAKLATIDELQNNLNTVLQWASQQQTSNTEASEDAQLESYMADLKSRHPRGFDEEFVLSKMLNGMSGDDAVNEYNALVERISTEAQRPRAPKILGSGSIVPGEQAIDPKKLDPKQTKDLVIQHLMAAAAQKNA